MRALYYPEFDCVEVSEQPEVVLATNEVLLRVAACGICGSELETFKNRSPRRPPPLIMGHEFCGTVMALGEGVRGFVAGQKVVSHSLVSCGSCKRCRCGDTHLCAQRQIFGMHRAGAFAEYVNVPSQCLLPWPDRLPAQAACLAEPLANGVHMVNLVRHRNPHTVLILGAGPIGLMAQQAFQAMLGCETQVADLSKERLEIAQSLGARRGINPQIEDAAKVVLENTGGEGVDLVVDAVGSQVTKKQSLASVRPGGAVIWIGLHENRLTFDSYDITLSEKAVFGTYAATLEELKQALDLMSRGAVDVTSWVQMYSLNQGVEAFQRMLLAKGSDIKAVIMP